MTNRGFIVFLLVPASLIMLLVIVAPLVRLVLISFRGYELSTLFTGIAKWIGFGNYINVFTDPSFLPILWRTIWFTATLIIGTIVIGLVLANALFHAGKVLRLTVSIILILAWATPSVASTLVWQWLFNPTFGVVNWLLTSLRIFGNFEQHTWFTNQLSAMFLIWLLVLWGSVPFVALTVYAAQSQLPRDFLEAAEIDGASGFRAYFSVVLPLLRPIVYLITILSIIWHFNQFNQIWILTQGGPNETTTILSIWTYQKAFAANLYGQGGAIAVLTMLVVVALTVYYIRHLLREGEIK